MALVAEALLLRQHHSHGHHREEQLERLRRFGFGRQAIEEC
jgi:hypothetical protein